MVWQNTTEERRAGDVLPGGVWRIQRFKHGSHADLRFDRTGNGTPGDTAVIGLCESVAEARVLSHAIEWSLGDDVGTPLEQLFDAGFVQDRRAPKSEMARITAELARRPKMARPHVSDSLIWMTRRNGALTIAIDEEGTAPLVSFYQDLPNERITCGSVFYCMQGAVAGNLSRLGPATELCAYLYILQERERLNGSQNTALQGDQGDALIEGFASGEYPTILPSFHGPRI